MARLLNKVAKISAFQAGDPGNQKTYFDSEIPVPARSFNLNAPTGIRTPITGLEGRNFSSLWV